MVEKGDRIPKLVPGRISSGIGCALGKATPAINKGDDPPSFVQRVRERRKDLRVSRQTWKAQQRCGPGLRWAAFAGE
jgi:hypothetical protein